MTPAPMPMPIALPAAAAIRWRPTCLLALFGAAMTSVTATAGPPPIAAAPQAPAPRIFSQPAAGLPAPARVPMIRGRPGGFHGPFRYGGSPLHGGLHRGRPAPAHADYAGHPGHPGYTVYPGRYYPLDALRARFAIASLPGRVGMIVVPVMLDGRGPFRFMIDTGATRTVLAASTLARLDLKADPKARLIVRGVGGRTVVDTVHVDTVDSGSMHFRDLTAPVLSGPVLNGLDGILGMDGLQGMTISANFVRDQVAVGASAATQAASMYVLRGKFVSQRLLMVPARIRGVLTEAIIDTGATHTLGNAALLAMLTHGHGAAAPLTRKNGVIDATQTVQPGEQQRIPSMQLGIATLTDLSVTFGDFGIFKTWGLQDRPALLLGMDVLGTVAGFSIDYRRAQLRVLPWPSPAG